MIHFVYWIFISASFGFIEAIMFHVADYNKLKKFNKQYNDIHVFFTLQRIMIYIAMFTSFRHMVLLAIPCMMVFPFFHDGVYYMMRNKLLPIIYERGFFDSPSISNTAKTSMPFYQRALVAIIGVMIFVFIYKSSIYQQ